MFKIVSPERLSAPPVANSTDAPYLDPAEPILRQDSAGDDVKSNAWDAFHSSPTPEKLIENLKSIPVSDDTKRALVQAKQNTAPAPDAVDRVIGALAKLKTLPPEALALGEKYPGILKRLIG